MDDEQKKKSQEKEKSSNELEKYWQVVRENPADFPGWTYLLHYVEQENNIEAAREAFCAFFKRYPYCYGYWKKYADMERTLSSSESAEQVFEEGVKAIPLSVDLWIHYLNFYKLLHKEKEDYEKVKQLFQRSLKAAGHEFRSDRLWDAYVTWEEENKNLKEVTAAYDTLLTIPTQLYSHHFEKFCKHVKKNSPRDILSTDEFLALRQEVVSASDDPTIEDDDDDKVSAEKGSADALPPGIESMDDAPPGMEAPEKIEKDMMSEEEVQLMKKKIIEKRRALHEKNEIEVGKRWSFEEGIKRPYFHVKALERAQLKNWKDYLDFEIENGTHERVVILFERCMIACALYEDIWMKYVRYMEEKDPESAGAVYERACTVHLPKKPTIHFSWAAYEEQRGNAEKASEILENLRKSVPDLLEILTRQINLERRRGNAKNVEELYIKYISEAKNNSMASFFSVKFARYLFKIQGDFTRAKEVLKEAVIQDPTNPKPYMQLVDVGFQQNPIDIPTVSEAFDMALSSDMTEDQKLVFSQRKLEFLEDFGMDPQNNQKSYEDHVKRLKSYYLSSRKRAAEESDDQEKAKRAKAEVNGVTSVTTASATTASTTVATTTTSVSAQDASSYQYHQSPWVGYHNSNYNYHNSWTYPSSYYSTH